MSSGKQSSQEQELAYDLRTVPSPVQRLIEVYRAVYNYAEK